MKIIIAGNFNSKASIERYYLKYLSMLPDIDIQKVDIVTEFRNELKNSFKKRLLRRFDIRQVYKNINKKIISIFLSNPVDVIVVFKGINILPSTLKKIKRNGIYIVNYNLDHPFYFAGRGSGNKNVTNGFKYYNLHISYSYKIIDEIKKQSEIPYSYLPFGYEFNSDLFDKSNKYKEINRACFIGNPDKNRARLLSHLLNNNIKIDVYGNNWKSWLKHENLNCYPPIYGDDFWIKTKQYRVQLNIFRKHNIGSHNMRSFEVPAIGGILLTPFSEEQNGFFIEDKEVVFYKTEEECVSKVHEILQWSNDRAILFRKSARERSVISGYSYKHRAFDLYNILKDYVKIKQ